MQETATVECWFLNKMYIYFTKDYKNKDDTYLKNIFQNTQQLEYSHSTGKLRQENTKFEAAWATKKICLKTNTCPITLLHFILTTCIATSLYLLCTPKKARLTGLKQFFKGCKFTKCQNIQMGVITAIQVKQHSLRGLKDNLNPNPHLLKAVPN